ncbi:hypothetical protein HanIR_Chr06g0263791 [Helianthus annuus]|nr:hypothetical protein HanIR_Chr06g0263791 [Helianthus annuus]
MDPLPSVEEAYATVRKETAHQSIFNNTSESGIAAGLAATRIHDDGALGLASRGQTRRPNPSFKPKVDKSKLKCTHCDMKGHTREQCFKIVGYPEWWNDGHKKKMVETDDGKGAAAVGSSKATNSGSGNSDGGGEAFGGLARSGSEDDNSTGIGVECFNSSPSSSINIMDNPCSQSNIISLGMGVANMAQSSDRKQDAPWIFDCGATDTMTCDLSDIMSKSQPKGTHIRTANGDVCHVKGGGTIEISPTLKLSNCLYIPSLSHKLLSISHITKELNCIVLMHPTFCILQDIRTGAIIGRGTERQGLYYVDEVNQHGTAMLAHGTLERKLGCGIDDWDIPPPVIHIFYFRNFFHLIVK